MIITFPSRSDVRITSDHYNFIVERLHVKGKEAKDAGAEFWKAETFHGKNLDQALRSVLIRDVLGSDETLSINEVLDYLKREASLFVVKGVSEET